MTPPPPTAAAPLTARDREHMTVQAGPFQEVMGLLINIVAHARHVSGAGPPVPPAMTADERDHPKADLLGSVAVAQQAEQRGVVTVDHQYLLLTSELGWALISGPALSWLIADLDGNQRCEVRRALTQRLCAVDHFLEATTVTTGGHARYRSDQE